MAKRKSERLSPAEYEQVTRLAAKLRRFSEIAGAVRLRPARESSPRGRVRSRLDCVLHDFIAPAVRDLDSIAATAARSLEEEGLPE